MRARKMNYDDEFYCCRCGNRGIPIARKECRNREAGHLKKLFCIYCNKETNHAECKPNSKYSFNEFKLEFNYHNFDNEQNRIMPFGEFKDKLMREGVDIYE